jgi:cell division protein FtsQ
LTQLIEKYKLGVDTISFSSEYEVILDCGDIKVLLGKKNTYDEVLSQLKNILAEAEGMEITIDMRNYVKGTNNIIAKPKKPTD